MKSSLGQSRPPVGSHHARVPVGAALRILVLAIAGVAGSVWGLLRYYEHRRSPPAVTVPLEREIPAPEVEATP